MVRFAFVVGTRPEQIKVAPVIAALRARGVEPDVICTGQHTTLLDDMPEIQPTHWLGIPSAGDYHAWIPKAGVKLGLLLTDLKPDWVVVQGDTMSAVVGALSAKLHGAKIAHIEAGVRSGMLDEPHPEEHFRRRITKWSHFHLAATPYAVRNLIGEGIRRDDIVLTGNPVVSALAQYGQVAPQAPSETPPTLLFTMHRREWLAKGEIYLGRCMRALCEAAEKHPKHRIHWPMHPHVRAVLGLPSSPRNLRITEPLGYRAMCQALASSVGIATDSGGLQEEAATLGVPCAVLRTVTDRPESVAAGIAQLFLPDPKGITRAIRTLAAREIPRLALSLYGKTDAAQTIAEALLNVAGRESSPQSDERAAVQ